MLVFWKQKLVFLAVPKTGTTALYKALEPHADIVIRNPPGLKHSHLYRFDRFLRPFLDRVEPRDWSSVAVMREPFDWIGSWYRYRRRPELAGHPNSTADVTFPDFVRRMLADEPPAFADVGSQAFFLQSEKSGRADTIYSYERLPDLLRFFEERLDLPLTLDRQNVSPKEPLELPPRLTRRLGKHLAEDMALYAELEGAGGILRR
jgi:hypothetical protein